jgi:hypothetical protein
MKETHKAWTPGLHLKKGTEHYVQNKRYYIIERNLQSIFLPYSEKVIRVGGTQCSEYEMGFGPNRSTKEHTHTL